jgi:anti-anti-sigma factor
MDMTIEPLQGSIIKVTLTGHLDRIGTQQIEPRFRIALETERRVIIDLAHVPDMAPEGIAMLLEAARKIHAKGGKIALLMPVHDVVAVLKAAHIEQTMPMYRDLHEALTTVAA